MKRTIIFMPALLLAFMATADQQVWQISRAFSPATNGQYFDAQNFNGGNSAPNANWTGSGAVTWDYAVSPAPLEGTGSLALTTPNASATRSISPTVGEIWVYFKFCYHNTLNHTKDDILDTYVAGTYPANQHGRVFLSIDGNLGLEFESNQSKATPNVMSPDITYHVWVHIKAGTAGNNESGSVAFVQDTGTGSAIEPTSGGNFATVASGTGTANYTFLLFYSTPGQDIGTVLVYDKVRISTNGDMGNNPL